MPPESQHNTTTLHVSQYRDDSYRFRLECGGQVIEHEISRELSAAISEDLRLLRWQAVGLVDNGDEFLETTGKRLGALILPETERGHWRALLRTTQRLVIKFESGAEALLNLPWELLNLGEGFFLRDAGCHIIREIPSPEQAMPRGPKKVLHVSLGVDPVLRLDQERCSLLDVLPPNIPIEFLLNPTIEEFLSAAQAAAPDIIVISGHGAYNDLSGIHSLETFEGPVETRHFVQISASVGCSLLLLWTCESARFGTALNLSTGELISPPDLICFTYPVAGGAALDAIKLLFEKLADGCAADEAATVTRDVDFRDSYAFFNLVHYHHVGQPFFRLTSGTASIALPSAPPCEGREFALTVLDVKAHENEVVTVIAPVGCDAVSLLRHFAALGSRSIFERSMEIANSGDLRILSALLEPIKRAVVTGSVDESQIKCSIIRSVPPSEYDGSHHEGVIVLSDLEGAAIGESLERKLGGRAIEIENHPLAGVPSFLDIIAAGSTPEEAQAAFETANRMRERMSGLSEEGKLFASWLYLMRRPTEVGDKTYEEYAHGMSRFGFSPKTVVNGIVSCLASNVILRMDIGSI